MDRKIIYPGQIPLDTDLLYTSQDTMIALAKMASALFGSNTIVNGLTVTAQSPATMSVNISAGEIYELANLEDTAYSSLPADLTHQIMKQGISMDQQSKTLTAPGTAGTSINYLIEATYHDSDEDAVVLPYYNSANPSQAFAGPNNSGTQQYTTRAGRVTVTAKAGIAATTGSQQTPSPDAGYVGLYVVTVAYGATSISASNISRYYGAPILPEGLAQSVQNSSMTTAVGTGTGDAVIAAFCPAITALSNGLALRVRSPGVNSITAPTFTPAQGISARGVVKGVGTPLVAGDIAGAGHWLELQYDLVMDKWVLLNPATGNTDSTFKCSLVSGCLAIQNN